MKLSNNQRLAKVEEILQDKIDRLVETERNYKTEIAVDNSKGMRKKGATVNLA